MIMSIPESASTLHPMATSTSSSSDTLRLELKAWEKEFAAAHEGRKASREDIKRNFEIAQKYKIYAKLRSGVSQTQTQPQPQPSIISSPSSHAHSTSKRPCPEPEPEPTPAATTVQTPQKRAKHTHSHSSHPAVLDAYAYDPPHSARKSPPTVLFRTSIGPTPQRDGKVLGLFDLLSPASSAERTPSKQQAQGSSSCKAGGVELSAFQTPSKRKKGLEDERVMSGGMLSGGRKRKGSLLSPADGSKRAHISSLLTPTARRSLATPLKTTPGSRMALEPQNSDETPAFLKRNSQHAYNLPMEDASREDVLDYDNQTITWTPVKPRLGTRMAGKGLSALLRGLREMEEEKLDDELDILRELEDEGNARSGPNKARRLFDVADSQIPEMPLGPDGAHLSDTNDNENDNNDRYAEPEKSGRGGRFGKAGIPWKKKGQKRTTRKFTLRPVLKGTWKPEPKWEGSTESEDEEDEENGQGVGVGEGQRAGKGEGQREGKGEGQRQGKGEGENGGISTIAETQITQQPAVPQDHPTLTEESEVSDANFEPEPETKSRPPGGDVLTKTKGNAKAKTKTKSQGKEHPIAEGEAEAEAAAEGEGELHPANQPNAKPKPKPKPKSKTNKQDPTPKPPKKINPTAHAHANFRALKLRNRGSKGNGKGNNNQGRGRRFGRR